MIRAGIRMRHFVRKAGLRASHAFLLAAALLDESNLRLAGIALLAMIIDLATCAVLTAASVAAEVSQLIAFGLAVSTGVTLGAARFFPPPGEHNRIHRWAPLGALPVIFVLTLLVRSSVLLALLEQWPGLPRTAIFLAAFLGDVAGGAAVLLFALAYSTSTAKYWPLLAVGVVTYTVALKLGFVGYLDLIPEEAYYWNYARHLDIGYLDHPPMVAWLIWLSTSLFGKSEFAVRLPAFLCWTVAAVFMMRLALNICGRSAAYGTVLLLAVLPIYFGLGFFMTPDAPLFAAWAASLYFLERALIAQEAEAWRRAGVCLGLAMLSKYPAALLGLATLLFIVIDRRSRHWLARREPYVAALIASVLFLPVVLWNLQNNWMSFAFQGAHRWSGEEHFSFHILIAAILLLLTPMGLLGIGRALLCAGADGSPGLPPAHKKRQHLWAVTFTLAPLSVFVLSSFFKSPKLNWTAPVWLAAIPLLALDMVAPPFAGRNLWAKMNRLWLPTVVALVLIHTGSFYYLSQGLPGAGPMSPDRLFGAWRELGEKVDAITDRVEIKNGTRPIVVGMDKNFISSELSFYGAPDDYEFTAGAHLFGQPSQMWAVWFPQSAAIGKDVVMIDFNRRRLTSRRLSKHFESLGDVSVETLKNNGRVVGFFYWRVGYAYRS